MNTFIGIIELLIGTMLALDFWKNLRKSADEKNWVRFFVAFVYLFAAFIIFNFALEKLL